MDGTTGDETSLDRYKELTSYANTIQQLIDGLYADSPGHGHRSDEDDDDDDEDDVRLEVTESRDGVVVEGRRSASPSNDDEGSRRGRQAVTVVKIGMQCTDVEHTFMVRDLKLVSQEEDKAWELTVYYNVFHFSRHEEFTCVLEMPATLRIDAIFDVFWSYKLCPECLTLIKKNDDVCEDCTFHKMRQQYGMRKGFLEEHHTCMICQEQVYHTKLQCGHAIHHTCVLGLNPRRWYTASDGMDIRCPLCRKMLTDYDKNRFFLGS